MSLSPERGAPETLQEVLRVIRFRARLCSVRARMTVHGMWVLSPGETTEVSRKVGVSPGRDWMSAEDGCSPDEGILCNYYWIIIVYDWPKC